MSSLSWIPETGRLVWVNRKIVVTGLSRERSQSINWVEWVNKLLRKNYRIKKDPELSYWRWMMAVACWRRFQDGQVINLTTVHKRQKKWQGDRRSSSDVKSCYDKTSGFREIRVIKVDQNTSRDWASFNVCSKNLDDGWGRDVIWTLQNEFRIEIAFRFFPSFIAWRGFLSRDAVFSWFFVCAHVTMQ